MTTLPLFNYPPTVVWVDDDELFLKTVERTLNDCFTLKTFNYPCRMLNYFDSYVSVLSTVNFFRGCADHEGYDTISHLPIDLNTDILKKIRENESRNNEISVIVVDYNMPNMNGLDLCRALQGLPVKKILLTGEVDSLGAVRAFNEGVIDRFVRKDSPTLVNEIKNYLHELTQQYFIDRTSGLLSHLEIEQPLHFSDPIFISFFKKWCEQRNISEYYLMDKYGSIFVIDKNGEKFYFIVHTDRTLDAFVDLYGDDEEVIDLVGMVARREVVPFFGEAREAWEFEGIEWRKYLYVPEVVEGRGKYYWFVTKINNNG